MSESRQSANWKRLGIEATAIVVSILLAFAIDAWWDDVQSDARTREILDAVHLEMESNLSNLQDSIAHHEEIRRAIGLAQDQFSIDGLLNEAVIAVEVFEPSTGALDTLIATGMLSNIDDPGLRISLAAFQGLAQDLGERENRAVEFRDAARRRIAEIGEPVWNRADPELVNADVQMLNLLTMRQAEEIDAIDSARKLEEHLVMLLIELES